MKILHRFEDGTAIGVDQKSLFVGSPKDISHSQLERKVAKKEGRATTTLSYKAQIIAQEDVELKNLVDEPPKDVYRTVLDAEGNLKTIEVKHRVYEWEQVWPQ